MAEQYNNWESYELTDEFVKKVPPKERHAFLRSLANQTNELKQGEHKNIIIFTDKHVYFYAATGYMNGSIEDTLKAGSKKANAEIKAWRDISGSSDTSTTTPDSMAQSYGSKRRRDGWDNDANGYIEEKGRADDVDEQAHESDAIGYNWESDGDFQEDEELIPGSYVYMDDGRAFKVSDNGTIEDIQFSDIDEDTQTTINQTMTMQQAKDMIQRAFVLNNIKAWYDDQYKNGDEWLAGEGATEVAAYIENTYEVYEKYIGSKYQGIVDGDWFVEDIVDAYVNKTLTGKAKVKTQWMDLNQNVAVADKRFYSPKEIKNAKQKLEIAKQRLTNSNKAAVTKARAEILLYAHNKGAAETLGLTEGELKKMLRQWGGYSASAREISMRFNNNVAVSNRWVGIENCSWLKSAQVSEKELARLVNSIEGDSRGFERNYIARTMLALDTHIDWSEIKFVFTGVVDPNRRSVRGLYNNETRTVTASYGSQNTVAHEMGHALDYKWARDLGFRENDYLTNRYLHASQLKTEEQKLWFAHFRDFVSSLTDKADLTSEYTMRDQEVFARFVASFVEWVDKTATGRASYGYMGFKDKFTGSDYVSFVKILQEKAMLDSKAMSAETDVQYSDIDEDVGNMSARDLYYNIARVSLDIDALERDIRLNPHGDNKLRESKLLDAKEKYVKYGEFLLANRENFALEKLYHLGHALKITNSYEMPKDYSLEQFKKDLGERVDEYKKSLDSAFESGMSRDDKKLYTFLKMMTYRYGEHINGSTEENVVTAEDDWLLDASEDMVFSDIDPEVDIYELLGENKRLAKENKILRADFERLMERRKLEGKLTHGKQLNKNQLDIVAGHIRNLGNSTYSKEKLVEKLNEVYTHIATSDELAWDDLFARFYGIAEDVLDEAKPVHSPNEYYANIYKELRNMEISLSDEQKQYVKSMLGVDASKAFFGKIKITDKGMPLNSKWEELAGKYPNEFATDNDKDQVIALLEIYETAKELKEVVEEYDKVEQTRWLANEIYNQYWNVSPIRTVADKYDKQIKRLKFEHRTAMKELRDSYNERLEKQKKADREERSRIFKKLREDHIKELQEIRKSGKERMDKYKEEAARKTRIQSVTADCLTLNEWLVKNSKDKHIHESMKGPVIALLNAIDFSSKRALGMWGGDMKGVPTKQDISLQKALSQVKDMMAEASVGKADLVLLYGHELDADIAKMIESVDNIMRTVGDNEFILNKMTLDDLITLDNVVKTIKHAVTNMNKFHAVHHAKGIADSAQEEIAYAEKLGDEKVYDEQSMKSAFKKLIKWTNATPYYAFKRLGAAGQKIFEAIQDGWDKLAFNVKQIIDFTQKAYKSEEVRAWEKELHEFEVLVPATDREKESADYKPKYQKVQMTTAQVMNLYLLNKREAAKRHLLGGGIKVKDITIKKGKPKIKGKKVNFTQDQIEKIVGTLTPRQIEVADALSHFMNTVASDWGNEVSMARFGVKMFGEKAYVPMQVDKSNINTPDPNDQNNSLFKLLNMSFTKGLTEGANNRLVVGSIFDVFAQHASDMAKYNALALPVLDAFRWYNYTEKTPVGEEGHDQKSVKDAIENAFGKDGLKYITTFLEDINGARQSNRDPLMVKFFKTSKLASVGFNLRVVLLQPTSYFRASAVINQKYLASALFHTPKTQKRGMERAEKYCGMALWKSLGYFDTNIQKGMTEQIKHDKGTYDKWVELSMKLAGKMDRVTLGVLWNAAEQELKSTRKDLVFGNEEFFVEVGKRLREIIYATQVVDSTVTRSEMMRSPDTGNKILTTFMSEPTLAYNMLADSVIQTTLDARELGSKKAAIKQNGRKIARVLGAYIITNAVAALVESGFDAFRDDDDEEMDLAEFMKAYLSNFATDMSVVGKLPYLKDGLSIAQGYSPSRSDLQWMQSAYYTAKGIAKHLEGEGNPVTTIKNGLKTISYLSGLGLYNAYRDFMATLHTLDILTAEELEEILGEFVE